MTKWIQRGKGFRKVKGYMVAVIWGMGFAAAFPCNQLLRRKSQSPSPPSEV
jgi:hypothetical protein